MKIETLRKKNIINAVVVVVLFGVFVASIFYSGSRNEALQKEAQMVKSAGMQLNAQARDLKSKTIEFKKYRENWPLIPQNRKISSGIKMDDVNAKLSSVAEKYNIYNPTIKVSLPEPINGGLFDRATLNVLFAKVNLTFEALDDARAINFLNDFISILPGYAVLTKVDMSKGKDYENQDLVAISMGRGLPAIKSSVDISWYALKAKEIKAQEGGAQ
jgi:hypothetical protein